jgi:hypothetical protein
LEVATMNKALGVVLCVLSVCVAGLCFAAWRPVTGPVVEALQAPPALGRPPAVLESGSVLVLAKPVQAAGKPRPVAARAKTWGCGERIVLQAGPKARSSEPSSARTCEWR